MTMTLKIGNRATLEVTSFADASAKYAQARDESGEGVSTFPEGIVSNQSDQCLARVSYNAKVWAPQAWRPSAEPLFDPYAQEA